MWSLGKDKPVIPGVAFIRWATAFPRRTAGSLSPAFAPARLVSLTVNHTSTFMLFNTVSDRTECNFERLRYPLGGDRPSQTTHHTVSPRGLAPGQTEGRISTAAPRRLAAPAQSLRPILHSVCPSAAWSCSKGSRGLSVPLRVRGIFTATSISPSSRPRQRPNRYTIRAGRNLPDKEFRYLRTVIVTAAVHPGFTLMLRKC